MKWYMKSDISKDSSKAQTLPVSKKLGAMIGKGSLKAANMESQTGCQRVWNIQWGQKSGTHLTLRFMDSLLPRRYLGVPSPQPQPSYWAGCNKLQRGCSNQLVEEKGTTKLYLWFYRGFHLQTLNLSKAFSSSMKTFSVFPFRQIDGHDSL